jgi:hypothetical protein
MPRKPIAEMVGGLSPRQRVWARIRRHKGSFNWDEVTPADVLKRTAKEYLDSLVLAGYLDEAEPGNYSLARDVGIEAPRVRKDGTEVTQGRGNEAIWGAITVLDSFSALDIVELSGVPHTAVKPYCIMLALAGYLEVKVKGKGTGAGGIGTVYSTVKSRLSGPRAPMITRLRAVYDPNVHAIVWSEGADKAVEAIDHV